MMTDQRSGTDRSLPPDPGATLDRLRRRASSRAVDLDALLERAVECVREAFDADRGTLYLIDHARDELVSHAGPLPELAEIRLRVGEGVAGQIAARGEPVCWRRGDDDPPFAARFDDASGYRTESLLGGPLRSADGELIGVLQLVNHRRGGFGEAERSRLADACARVAALLMATSLRTQLRPGLALPLAFRFNHVVGDAPAMRETFRRAARASATEATVLLRGETGTGKGLLARAIHDNSARRRGPLVQVDCAALPASLIENELFGHEQGAFTGADRRSEGKVHAAEGGTLFVDEVGDLPTEVQGKLMRLVQERSYLRVGGAEPRVADVRLLFATHRDLERRVSAERFRRDLYYRIRVVELTLPPLRERGHGDLERLIDHFLAEFGRRHRRAGVTLTPAARAALHAHSWPGNVRELEHCLESAVVLAPSARIEREDLPIDGAPPDPATGAAAGPERFVSSAVTLREVERAYCRHVVALCEGNRTRAARRLDIGRNTLLRKLRGGA